MIIFGTIFSHEVYIKKLALRAELIDLYNGGGGHYWKLVRLNAPCSEVAASRVKRQFPGVSTGVRSLVLGVSKGDCVSNRVHLRPRVSLTKVFVPAVPLSNRVALYFFTYLHVVFA